MSDGDFHDTYASDSDDKFEPVNGGETVQIDDLDLNDIELNEQELQEIQNEIESQMMNMMMSLVYSQNGPSQNGPRIDPGQNGPWSKRPQVKTAPLTLVKTAPVYILVIKVVIYEIVS